jgi:hypothetical protein
MLKSSGYMFNLIFVICISCHGILFDGFSFEFNQAALLFKEAGQKHDVDRELPGSFCGLTFRLET